MVEGDKKIMVSEMIGNLITIGVLCLFVGLVVCCYYQLFKLWWETKDFRKRR